MEMNSQTGKRRIFVDHGEAYGNLGDEAMLLNALRRLTSYLGPCEFVIPRESNRPLPDLHGYEVIIVSSPFLFYIRMSEIFDLISSRLSRLRIRPAGGLVTKVSFINIALRLARIGILRNDYGLRRTIEVLRGCDVFYGVGAADFNDFNANGAAYKCWLYGMARAYVPALSVSAQGFGPLNNADLGLLMSRAFDKLDFLGFRDHSFSADYTRRLGLRKCRTKVTGDEAFTLAPSDEVTRNSYLASAGLSPGESFIAVHWRSTDYTQETEPLFPLVARVFEYAAQQAGLRLVFFPMSYDVHSRYDDECCKAITGFMQNPSLMSMAPVTHDVHVIKSAIGASRFTLGLSYHVHVFGLSQRVPSIILYSGDYYRFKSDGLVQFYGPPNAAIDVCADGSELSAKSAIRRIIEAQTTARADIQTVNDRILADNDWILHETALMVKGAQI